MPKAQGFTRCPADCLLEQYAQLVGIELAWIADRGD
jgi:hypothetical protein